MVELWTEEERKAAKEYESTVANLEEERAKHKKVLNLLMVVLIGTYLYAGHLHIAMCFCRLLPYA